MQKLLQLEQVLHHRVIGQEEAVTTVSEVVIRARAGLKELNRQLHLSRPYWRIQLTLIDVARTW